MNLKITKIASEITKILIFIIIFVISFGTCSMANELTPYEIWEYFSDFEINYDEEATEEEKKEYIKDYLDYLEGIDRGSLPKYTINDLEEALEYLQNEKDVAESVKEKLGRCLSDLNDYKMHEYTDPSSSTGGSTTGGTTESGGSTTGGGTTESGGSTTGGGTTESGGSTTGGTTTGSGGSTTGGGITSFEDIQQQAKDFISKGEEGTPISIQDAIDSFIPIGRVLVGVATIVLIAVGGIFGVKYMLVGANDKAQMKEKLIFYVISIVLVYGAVGIFSIVVTVMNNILS